MKFSPFAKSRPFFQKVDWQDPYATNNDSQCGRIPGAHWVHRVQGAHHCQPGCTPHLPSFFHRLWERELHNWGEGPAGPWLDLWEDCQAWAWRYSPTLSNGTKFSCLRVLLWAERYISLASQIPRIWRPDGFSCSEFTQQWSFLLYLFAKRLQTELSKNMYKVAAPRLPTGFSFPTDHLMNLVKVEN